MERVKCKLVGLSEKGIIAGDSFIEFMTIGDCYIVYSGSKYDKASYIIDDTGMSIDADMFVWETNTGDKYVELIGLNALKTISFIGTRRSSLSSSVTVGERYRHFGDNFINNLGKWANTELYDWKYEEIGATEDRIYNSDIDPILSEDPLVNPKKAAGAVKAPLHAYPMLPIIQMANVMAGGAHKYGLFNYRKSKVDALTYIGAIQRHLLLWADGEDNDVESGQSHLAHVMACSSILLDCLISLNMVDNRSKTGLMKKEMEKSQKEFAEYIINNKSLEQRNEDKI